MTIVTTTSPTLVVTSTGSMRILDPDTIEFSALTYHVEEGPDLATLVTAAASVGRAPDAQSMLELIRQEREAYNLTGNTAEFVPSPALQAGINAAISAMPLTFTSTYRSNVGTNGVPEEATDIPLYGNLSVLVDPNGFPETDEYFRVVLNGQVLLEITGLPPTVSTVVFYRGYEDQLKFQYYCGGSSGPAERFDVVITRIP